MDSQALLEVIHCGLRWIMIRSYSLDLRTRVVAAVDGGMSRRAAARHFAVSESSAVRWSGRAASEGSCAARRLGRPAGKGPLSDHLEYLIARVEAEPDITMPELAEWLMETRGISADPASLSRLLCRAGFTYKKTADGLGVRSRRRR
jgi:transposase